MNRRGGPPQRGIESINLYTSRARANDKAGRFHASAWKGTAYRRAQETVFATMTAAASVFSTAQERVSDPRGMGCHGIRQKDLSVQPQVCGGESRW